MAATRINLPRLRLRWPELDRLTWALVVSLLIHGALYGAYQGNKKFHWLEKIRLPAWMQKVQEKLVALPLKKNPAQNQIEPTLVFVEVDPTASSVEPPKDAKYYSSNNSKAANPDADKESNAPKINGSQEEMIRTADASRSKAFPLQPTVPRSKQEQPEEKQRRSQIPGDLAISNPDSTQHKDDGQAEKPRPRTLIEAMVRQQQQGNPLPGRKMKQDGGVKRNSIIPSLDAKRTLTGDYDYALIQAVQNRWDNLLESRSFAGERTGKVSLVFHLHPDGRVTDMKVEENTVDELLCLLCQKAIMDPSPFEKWPSEMRIQIGSTFREIRFSFFYN